MDAPFANRTDPDALASLAALWRTHCEAAAARLEREAASAGDEPGAWDRQGDIVRWRALGSSDAALALFCLDLDGGERQLALSAASPSLVEGLLMPFEGWARAGRPARQLGRARTLCERLSEAMLSNSKPAPALFPDEEPFRAGGAAAHAAGMRGWRLAHMAAVVGPAGAIPALASCAPAFSGLAMACAAATALAGATLIFGPSPERACAAKIAKAAWPALSAKSIRGLLAKSRKEARALAELSSNPRPPLPGEDEAIALLGPAGEIFLRGLGSMPEPARSYCAAPLAACERRELAAAAEPPRAGGCPRGKSRSL